MAAPPPHPHPHPPATAAQAVAGLIGWQREVYVALAVLGGGARRRVVTRQTLCDPARLTAMTRRLRSTTAVPDVAITLATERLRKKGLLEYPAGGRGRYRLTAACPLPDAYALRPLLPPPPLPLPVALARVSRALARLRAALQDLARAQ